MQRAWLQMPAALVDRVQPLRPVVGRMRRMLTRCESVCISRGHLSDVVTHRISLR
eukprot:SAG31_NODE_38332_length_297_cov_0.671717_1_plen_54_part_01